MGQNLKSSFLVGSLSTVHTWRVGRIYLHENKMVRISNEVGTIKLMPSSVLPARDTSETDGKTVTSF